MLRTSLRMLVSAEVESDRRRGLCQGLWRREMPSRRGRRNDGKRKFVNHLLVPRIVPPWPSLLRGLVFGKRPVNASCRTGKQRFVDLGSFRRRKRYGQPATRAKLQGVWLLLARHPATSRARTPRR